MGLKNKFLESCKDDFISADYSNKFTIIRNLGGIIGIVFEEYNKGRLILLTYAINNKYTAGAVKITGSGVKYIEEKANELKGYDIKLIDEVIYNTYKFNPTTSSLEDKFNVASD